MLPSTPLALTLLFLLSAVSPSVAPEPPEVTSPRLWPGLDSHPILVGYDKQVVHHRSKLDDGKRFRFDEQASKLRVQLMQEVAKDQKGIEEGTAARFKTQSGRALVPHLRGLKPGEGPLKVVFSLHSKDRTMLKQQGVAMTKLATSVQLPGPRRSFSATERNTVRSPSEASPRSGPRLGTSSSHIQMGDVERAMSHIRF